jgi:hypothetical protein
MHLHAGESPHQLRQQFPRPGGPGVAVVLRAAGNQVVQQSQVMLAELDLAIVLPAIQQTGDPVGMEAGDNPIHP